MAAGLQVLAAQTAFGMDCTLRVQTRWLDTFPVTAQSQGDCGQSEVSLTIHNDYGHEVWHASYDPSMLFGFDQVDTPTAMHTALEDWIRTTTYESSTGALPVWPEGADGPDFGEFSFRLAEGVERGFYEMSRDIDLMMICYVQGQESMMCLFHLPDELLLEPIVYQLFPG